MMCYHEMAEFREKIYHSFFFGITRVSENFLHFNDFFLFFPYVDKKKKFRLKNSFKEITIELIIILYVSFHFPHKKSEKKIAIVYHTHNGYNFWTSDRKRDEKVTSRNTTLQCCHARNFFFFFFILSPSIFFHRQNDKEKKIS